MADPLIGQVIADRYKIRALLGRGGMGVVYKVEHVHIGKLMAMKLLAGELASDANTVRRFRREAKAVSKLTHPNTVQVFDFGQSAKLAYLVMEYLPGKDFAQVIQAAGSLPFVRVAKICAQVASSVAEAHERGIVHRDIKPENVMILDTPLARDHVKVLDFGIAKLRDAEDVGIATQSGHLVGTPYYMAPEQIRGEPIDHRVDIYSLGAMMYKALAGVPPFSADTPMAVLTKHLTEPLVPVRRRVARLDVPEEADAIIERAMQKDPAQRYARMEDLRDDLLRYLHAVGELDTTTGGGLRSLGSVSRSSSFEPGKALATRGDVDRYERALRRTGWLGSLLGVVLAGGIAYAGYELYRHRPASGPPSETEPNNEPLDANLLSPKRPLRGYLGKRISVTYSDADVYRFELPLEDTRVADISVSAIPNMDLVLELVRKGTPQPLLLVDTGKVGEPERIPNVTLRGGSYYVRVREFWEAGRLPTENVSDPYSIALRLTAPSPEAESEPNDVFDLAETLRMGEAKRGLMGWAGDRDMYCFAPPQDPATLEVSAAGDLDLSLTLIERSEGVSTERDARSAKEGEILEIAPLPSSAQPCVQVAVHEHPELPRADFEHPYTLLLKPR